MLFPKGARFLPELEAELLTSPQGKTDDQEDSITQAPFNHLVDACLQRQGYGDAKCLGSFEVNSHFEFDRRLYQAGAAPWSSTGWIAPALPQCLAGSGGAAGGDRSVVAMASAAARLLRAYATQVEALRRLRHGGSQTLRVEHVHVNEGGQAVIGNVNPIPGSGPPTIG